MKLFPILVLALSMIKPLKAKAFNRRTAVRGIDVSEYHAHVTWDTIKANGVQFVYIKATEGTGTQADIMTRWTATAQEGLIRGSYHFARPDISSGDAQAKYFLRHGGGWSADGQTLPGALNLEQNPYGLDRCYGKSKDDMVAWIRVFSDTYHAQTERQIVIYTTTDWWRRCTGNDVSFGSTNPLWIAHFSRDIGTLPTGWHSATFWQYSAYGPTPGDANRFLGSSTSLVRYVTNLRS
ncbi:glycoside hydrolase family 25 protein [Amanita muscaria Koide BX008]|uniref:N,O-diacetylmuramidase n=1 Tax=Amanita muscaria (strain Koide BX008) TaxID=946122 RepID=A0A0C2X0M6_AMAMK|nr:glycoside hydrolase family 25 protein [Amanita muscaria Koide BX008]